MRSSAKPEMTVVGLTVILIALGTAFDNGATGIGAIAAEPSGTDERKEKEYDSPMTAFEYAKLVEPQLGVPPKIILDDCIEIPLYVDGVQRFGVFKNNAVDNPTRLHDETTTSGSVMQRYEGKTADGKPMPDVVWVAFGRNETGDGNHRHFNGSVQMIGYNRTTGATAFFETSATAGKDLNPWITQDETTLRMRGEIPWIDEPEEFNKVFVTPAAVKTQCNSCHQADPFITSPFVNAAKIPGTDEAVLPFLDADAPYYVIGGEDWDMRTIHLEGNACFECHRVGMKTVELFTGAGWDVHERMPPYDPGSLVDDYQALLDAWSKGPEHVDGAEWIIPPARGKDRRIVGDDYPHKARFNEPRMSVFMLAEQPDGSDGGIWNAAGTGDVAAIARFLDKGTDVNFKNPMGFTPLMAAAVSGETEAMKLLINWDADLEVTTDEGSTALHLASFLGQTEAVRLLVDSGADVGALNGDGETAIQNADQPLGRKSEWIFQFVSEVLNVDVDPEQVRAGRPQVVDYLRSQQNATHKR